MSSLVYFLADLFPFWAIPLALICFELARFYGRYKKRQMMLSLLAVSAVLMVLSVSFFVFDGRSNLRGAMQNFERSYLR